ncbi:sodium:solute symporter family protein [Mammaliicoccus sciuri]|uniref:sodium:solute symporter n=1 Tax=Mammaliicoccus sciuri TaxID=1296 RepID=UPI000734A652|nr:sodium:solute symporter [Mammaliicoccus sciuri]KTT80079.1 Na+/proline symporter [Mammaliicoccus sciuri]MBG9206184.1 sodium:solute symporter [Mammaliicoccus sciuri]MCC2089162.1 sodium:solute symporter [Mammaliicoccus sciuri]MCJ0955409.1 sodium:solute symporter [Mammaliicoccus sciuri]MCJ1759879.1 sodium:solute symporter [Mammaliicoccus sciuri]
MNEVGFGTGNWIALILYLIATLLVGVYFTKRAGQDTDAFFKAKGRVPAWAVGFSIYATTLSAITYMGTPERAFNTDWSYASGNIAIIAIIPLLIYFYIPFFRKLDVTTAYEYLEERFGITMRVIGSLAFTLFHIGRVAIVIYLPTLAITSVSDINPYLIAALVGLLCVIYTFMGGIEGVIWSDVIQGIILLGGAVAVIFLGAFQIDGNFGTVLNEAVQDKKFVSMDNWKFGTAAAAIPIIFIGSIFNNLHQYTASQDIVQRYQTTGSISSTNKSLWTNGLLAFITIPIFYGMGTVLYSFYNNVTSLPEGFNTSAIVPYFILTQIPPFVGGLLIAAIFAAAQSTISSSLNSISACVVVDLKQRFSKTNNTKNDVLLARIIIILAGVFSTLASLYLINQKTNETWDLFLLVTGLFGVPIAGVFAVGIFTKKANTYGVIIGLIVAAIVSYFVGKTDITPFTVSVIGFFIAFAVGYVASLPFAKHNKNIVGLTIHTINDQYVKETK